MPGEKLMIYAADDAERSSACEILYACRGKIAADIRQEASRGLPDAQRLADLERVMSQLRNDIVAVRAGDRAVTTRVRVMYGMLVRAWYAPTSA
ncbi:hypothetical protein P3W33_15530 [Luteibacter sp. PPL552]